MSSGKAEQELAKKQYRDWSLPPAFLARLKASPEAVLDELVPLKPIKSQEKETLDEATRSHPFIDAMKSTEDVRTEKGALAHQSTDAPLVDLFFDLAPGVEAEHLFNLLKAAWKDDALSTLKIVFHSRSIHGGKGYKDGFFRAVAWVWEHHPRTLLENEKQDATKRQRTVEEELNKGNVVVLDDKGDVDLGKPLVEYSSRPHGTFDDLLDLLVLHINGQLDTSYTEPLNAVDEGLAPAKAGHTFKKARLSAKAEKTEKRDRSGFKGIVGEAKKLEESNDSTSGAAEREFRVKLLKAPDMTQKHHLLAERLASALKDDEKFQALYITVAHIFHKYLKADLQLLDQHREALRAPTEKTRYSPHLLKLSFAAKWAPAPGKSADKTLHIATGLSALLFPSFDGYWARQKLQKEVLTPLREALAVPEVAMSNRSWKINYTKVPSRAMSRYAQSFADNDPKGFQAYLEKVASGRDTISGASMMPHELLLNVLTKDNKWVILKQLAGLQWATLVESIRSSSSSALSNCIAIADVSGSMGSTEYNDMGSAKAPQPILPCIALTLLLSELSEAPWKGHFFKFSEDPTFEYIDPALPLAERAAKLNRSNWGGSTHFAKTYELILQNAKKEKLAPRKMVKKLFVFSDMQFDSARSASYGETEHQVMRRRFKEEGYKIPELVYWNLATREKGTPKPAKSNVEGVTLFSGFSGALMKFIFGEEAVDEDVEDKDDELQGSFEAVKIGEHDEGGNGTVNDGEKKKKIKANPLDQVRKAIGIEPFAGLKVID
ncbi:hypothetical protein L202_02050 [Cryptococcus amylolentus CBS 6039]|uniref:TROVE domain-containing protein n=1 Tax=Cryptococcus amylolentus CBS 6039 TaxID=1295533 RepID=A0A1E3HZ83_9TREE|nr:hypothetical protein L202_02050 [Cryptococcus amylolentus CBS 6039]ODN81650.1 hypothetical protein L202_02050 [Cryptococcus amylolentus CBS 6039]